MRETTALGSAIVAGFAAGVWQEFEELKKINSEDRMTFKPEISKAACDKLYAKWERAVEMSRGWLDSDRGAAST